MTGNSWVTLATNDSYSLGALVLGHSLKRTGTVHSLSVMVTPGVSSSMREQLSTIFNVVQEVNILDSKDEKNLSLLTRPELGVTFTKLHCWKLTQFTKCVFLDADVLVLRNCDELFEREELSAAPDVGWPDCFNSGVFVYRPSNETYNAIINLALSQGSFDGGDQGLLNQFFSDWATKDISRHLPFIYNMCSSATYSYLPAFKQFGQDVKIVHFIGSSKPWLQYLDSETRQVRPTLGSEHLQGLLQLWWDIFCNDVHSKLSSEMVGLAGALSQLTLGVARSPEQVALEEHLRKQAWEHGSIDYMGRDSFDNIWRKICQTLAEPLPDPLPEKCEPPSQVSGVIVNTVSQEVTTDDISLTALPQSQSDLSACKEIKDTISSGINSSVPFNRDEIIISTSVGSDINSEPNNIILTHKEIILPKSSAENKPNDHPVSTSSLLHDSAGNISTLPQILSPEHSDSSLLMSSEIIPDSHKESQQLQQTSTVLKKTQISEAENISQAKTLSNDIPMSNLPYPTSTQIETYEVDNNSDLFDSSLIQKGVNTLSQKDLFLESDSLGNDSTDDYRIVSQTSSDKLERQLDDTGEQILPIGKEFISDNNPLSSVSLGAPERKTDLTSSSEPTLIVENKSILESDTKCVTSSDLTEKHTDSNITGELIVMDSSNSNVIDEISSDVVEQSYNENDTAKSEFLDSLKINVTPVALTAKSSQTETKSTSVVSQTVPQDVKVIGPTPPTSPGEIFVPGTGAFDDTSNLTIDLSIPETPPLDSHCSVSSTSNISNIASTSEIEEKPVQSSLSQAVDPQPPVPPKRRHRPSHKAQRGKK